MCKELPDFRGTRFVAIIPCITVWGHVKRSLWHKRNTEDLLTMRIPRNRTLLISVLIFLVAFIPRSYIALQPIPTQLQKTLPDDAYYYFLTAQNILDGDGPSVDGRNDSNGWHPLWLAVNLIVFSQFDEQTDTPIHLSLLLGAVADSFVAIVLFSVLRRFIDDKAAAVGALFYAINSMPMLQSVNGLETGLAALLIALSWAISVRAAIRPQFAIAALWGAVFGLCFLARTDTALILLPLGVFVLKTLPSARRWPFVAIGVLTALLVTTPWFVINTLEFGSPLAQTSATAVPTAIQMRHELKTPDIPLWRLSIDTITEPAPWLRGDYFGAPAILAFLLWPMGVWGLGRAWSSAELRALWLSCVALLLGGVALIAVHTLIRWYPRPWYFVVNAQVLAISLSFCWVFISPRARLVGFGIVSALLLAFGILMWRAGYYPWQDRQYKASTWLRQQTLPTDVIASMNSGIMGYYSGRTVINLDGVVNPQAFDAITHSRLLDYMREEDVRYFVDFDHAVHNEYGPFLSDDYADQLEEIAVIDEPYEGLGSMRVYRLQSVGAE